MISHRLGHTARVLLWSFRKKLILLFVDLKCFYKLPGCLFIIKSNDKLFKSMAHELIRWALFLGGTSKWGKGVRQILLLKPSRVSVSLCDLS